MSCHVADSCVSGSPFGGACLVRWLSGGWRRLALQVVRCRIGLPMGVPMIPPQLRRVEIGDE